MSSAASTLRSPGRGGVVATPSAPAGTPAAAKNHIFDRYTRSSLFLGRGGRGQGVGGQLDLEVLAGHVDGASGQVGPAVAVPEADRPAAGRHVLDLEATVAVEAAEVARRHRDDAPLEV